MQAVDNDEARFIIIPSYKSTKIKDAIDRIIKNEGMTASLLEGRAYNVKMTKFSRLEAISRIGLLYSDIVSKPYVEQQDCYDDLIRFCTIDNPFLVIHKSADIFSDQLFREQKMKPSGSITSGGAWLPDEVIDSELTLAEELGKRWNKQSFSVEPPFTEVCGHLIQLDSYHHSDATNSVITVNTNASNSKVPLNFIRLSNSFTQALLRYTFLFLCQCIKIVLILKPTFCFTDGIC